MSSKQSPQHDGHTRTKLRESLILTVRWLVIAFSLSLCPLLNVAAETPITGVTVPLAYGLNKIKLGNINATAVLARRENFNAHGFDVLSLYVVVALSGDSKPVLNIVPAFADDAHEQLQLNASGGADCMLHDFRLVKQPDGATGLVIADRALGSGYVDQQPVTFEFYSLRHNDDGSIGRPVYYFEKTSSITSGKRYCDVEQAFKEELGLSDYRSHRS